MIHQGLMLSHLRLRDIESLLMFTYLLHNSIPYLGTSIYLVTCMPGLCDGSLP